MNTTQTKFKCKQTKKHLIFKTKVQLIFCNRKITHSKNIILIDKKQIKYKIMSQTGLNLKKWIKINLSKQNSSI